MASNPIERNFVTRFLLGLVVIGAMAAGGAFLARPLTSLGGPVAGFVGMFVGALLVFALFAGWYSRYTASFATDRE